MASPRGFIGNTLHVVGGSFQSDGMPGVFSPTATPAPHPGAVVDALDLCMRTGSTDTSVLSAPNGTNCTVRAAVASARVRIMSGYRPQPG